MTKIIINGQNYTFRFSKFSFASKLYVLSKMTEVEIESLAHAILEVEGQNLLLEQEEVVAFESEAKTTEKTT